MTQLTYPFEDHPEAGEAIKVADGVHWIRMPLPFGLDHINLWLLEDGDGWTIIDSGLGVDNVKVIWEDLLEGFMQGRPVKRLICTHYHPDHFGLAGWLCDRCDIMVWMARAEFLLVRSLVLDVRKTPPREVMRFYHRAGLDAAQLQEMEDAGYGNLGKIVSPPPAAYRRLRDGDTLTIGAHQWDIVSGRGHSPEHLCLYNPELGVLISGDQVLPRISSNVSVYPTEPFANPLKDWLESHEKFKKLPADTLVLPAHNEPFYGLHARLNQLIESHHNRLQEIVDLCDTPMTAASLVLPLFKRELKGIDFMLGLGECLAHLHYLVEDGRLTAQDDAAGTCYFQRSAQVNYVQN